MQWMGHVCVTKSIDILNKNTPGVKKGEAKSEAPKVTLFIYVAIRLKRLISCK